MASFLMALLLVLPSVFINASYAEPQAGEKNHITKVDFNYYYYEISKNTSAINVTCQTDGISPENFDVLTFDKTKNDWVYAKGTFKAGERYRLRVTFAPKGGYDFVGLTKENIQLRGAINPINDGLVLSDIKGTVTFELPTLTEPIKYKLTFDTNGGSNIEQVIGLNGDTIDLSKYIPTKKGFDFKGWYEDQQLTKRITEVILTKDMTIYTKWSAKVNPPASSKKFTITVNPNEGNWNGDTSIKSFVVKKGEYFTLPEAPIRDGYTFKYWQGSKFQPGDKYMVNGEHDFVAIWEKNTAIDDKNYVDKNNKDINSKNTPRTGDNTSLFSLIFILILSGISMTAFSRKNSEEN